MQIPMVNNITCFACDGENHSAVHKRKRRCSHLFFLVLLCLFSFHTLYSQLNPAFFSSDTLLIFVPLKDNSGFKGRWDVTIDVPRFFSVYMKERFKVGIINPISVKNYAINNNIQKQNIPDAASIQKYAEQFRTRYVVTAVIEEFSVSRFMVSEVQLAGYEAFSATVLVSFVLHDAAKIGRSGSQSIVFEGEASGTVKDRGLGITLFGKQTDRTSQFYSLDEIAFGSEQFNTTIIGEALLKCAEDLGSKLERAIPNLISRSVVLSSNIVIDSLGTDSAIVLRRRLINGEIVIVDGDEVFINIGSSDGIAVGDVLPVFISGKEINDPKTGDRIGTNDEKVGEIQVIEIRAERLSLGTIISGKGSIKPKQRVRKVIVR